MFGISDHDLMFNKEAHHSDEEEHADEGNDYIQNRVRSHDIFRTGV